DIAEELRLQHRALREINEIVTEPLAEPDQRGQTRIARPHQAEPSSPPRRRNDLQRLHQTRIDPDPFERSGQRTKLHGTVGSSFEMLQSTAAASAEMQAWRIGMPRPGSEPLDNPTLTPYTSSRAEPSRAEPSRAERGR